jgi:predicted HicB family RNase H-like nuclease
MLSYKGFVGSADYDDNAEVFFGTVVNANTIVSFRGASMGELKASFHDLVDSYLEDGAKGSKRRSPFRERSLSASLPFSIGASRSRQPRTRNR